MSGVFSGQQWTRASGSTWSVIIEPDFVNAVAELCNHLALSSTEARSNSEQIVTKSQAASGDSGSKEARKEVVKEIIDIAGKGVNQGAEAKDIQGFANLAVSLIKETHAENEADSLYTSLASGIAKSPSGESLSTVNARYSALSSIFNSLSESVSYETRSSVLLSLFKLAVEKDNLAILSPALAALPTWLSSEWGIQDTSAADRVLSSFVEVLEGSSSDDKAEIVRQLLLSYANENTDENLRSKLLLYTLASSSAFDIESLPSVSSNGDLAKVREIFLSGSISDLSSVSSSLPAPLNASKLQEKLQYVLLADYCSNKVGQSISYDEVAKVLGLESSTDEEDRAMEVESWIIATIRVKLLVARLHEPSSTISVLRASPRHFGKEQWSTLQSRLESWQNHMGSILDTVGRALGQSGSSSNSRDRHAHDAQHLTQAQHSGSQQQQQQQQQTEAAVIEVA